jgi:hypothetical protein
VVLGEKKYKLSSEWMRLVKELLGDKQ